MNVDPGALRTSKGLATYIAIGPQAFAATLAADLAGPVLALFLSSESYWATVKGAGRGRSKGFVTGIFAEASPLHQMQLIARIYERRVTVAVLLTDATAHIEPMVRQAARDTDLDVQVERVAPNTDVLRALMRVSSATVLLAVPDSKLFTAATLRDVLESTYRRGQPVIGFSTAMVTAGTLATAYSSIDDTVAHVAETIDTIERGHTPEPEYPKYWQVAINENVARSLNIVISDAVRSMGNRPTEGRR